MMKGTHFFRLIFVWALVFTALFRATPLYAESTGIEVNLGVEGCNNNGICEVGENELSCPVDCAVAPAGGGSSGYMPPEDINLYNISIQANFTDAMVYWSSSVSTKSILKWGQTTEVKEGVMKSVVFAQNHKVEIINLKPGTMYYFTIESEDARGRLSTYPPLYFFTKFEKDTTLPRAPSNFQTSADSSGINLSWQNPSDPNFSYVRIMRHEDRLRGDPFLGKLIYEGKGENFLDKNVVEGKEYFYVIFSRDLEGNFSSGVGANQVAYSSRPVLPEEGEAPSVENISQTFFVHQYNQSIEPLTSQNPITIESDKSTVVDTNTKTLPDDLVVVRDDRGEVVGQYLFSFNNDSGRFQAVVLPLVREGVYQVKIYRYRDNVETIISQGSFNVVKSVPAFAGEVYCTSFICLYWPWILLLILLILIILLLRRRRKNREI